MLKIALIFLGVLLLLVQNSGVSITSNTQYFMFIVGVLLLGIPHGAADLLVAARNADVAEKKFSKKNFFFIYLGRLVLFAFTLYLFPIAGTLLFIFFAAYHFGETDLHQFKTNTLPGKIFVVSYGLVILSVILLHHFDEVIPIYEAVEPRVGGQVFINWISQNRYYILSGLAILFFVATFFYFIGNGQQGNSDPGQFLLRFAFILFILFKLPMLLGFTFYFVVWHSLLSLQNIIRYLRQNKSVTYKTISKQILLYSALAITGIGLFGLAGYMFIDRNAIAGYIFLGLAVLTAPHMEIMYYMYDVIRQKKELNRHNSFASYEEA